MQLLVNLKLKMGFIAVSLITEFSAKNLVSQITMMFNAE
jgi:hypothetical protein